MLKDAIFGASLPGVPRLFTFGWVGGKEQATSAAPLWSSAQNYKNAKCSFFLFLMNKQSQRNHWREKSDFKPNHKIISTLIRSHKCRKWKFHYSIFLEHKRMIDSCTVSSAKPYYPSQSCSLFVSLYVWLALPSPHLCCNWKKANYSAGSGDQRNASKKWNWCYNLVESLPMGNKKHVESARPQPKLHLRFYVPSVKDIADHHATSVQF